MKAFKTELITQKDDFLALESEWDDLLLRGKRPNIFLSWEWISTWYQFFGEQQKLWMVSVRDEENGQLLAVAPLMLDQRKVVGSASLNELCFIGSNVGSDHMDFVVDQQYTNDLVTVLKDFINQQNKPWDLVHIANSCNDAIAHKVLATSNAYYYPIVCPYLALPESWADYTKTLGKKRRYKIGVYRRKLEEAYPNQVTYQCVKTTEELKVGLTELFALHQQAQQAQGRQGAFLEETSQAFHNQVCLKFLEKDWLRLYFLRVEGKPIAVVYSFFYHGTVSFYTTGFDLLWSAHSPGQQIIYYALEQSINDKAKIFDFLRGDEDYKFMMTKTVVEDQRFIVPQTLVGKGVAWAFKKKKELKK